MPISAIPLYELKEDRAASMLDLLTCKKLYASLDRTDVDGPRLEAELENRIIGNNQIVAKIDEELERCNGESMIKSKPHQCQGCEHCTANNPEIATSWDW